jgi:hypothetical protein
LGLLTGYNGSSCIKPVGVQYQDDPGNLQCGLTLEDDFTLTRIRNKAHSLQNKDRDQFLWTIVYRLICRERAYRAVMDEVGISVDTNVALFEDDTNLTES